MMRVTTQETFIMTRTSQFEIEPSRRILNGDGGCSRNDFWSVICTFYGQQNIVGFRAYNAPVPDCIVEFSLETGLTRLGFGLVFGQPVNIPQITNCLLLPHPGRNRVRFVVERNCWLEIGFSDEQTTNDILSLMRQVFTRMNRRQVQNNLATDAIPEIINYTHGVTNERFGRQRYIFGADLLDQAVDDEKEPGTGNAITQNARGGVRGNPRESVTGRRGRTAARDSIKRESKATTTVRSQRIKRN